jgi:hypothetical protein
MTGSVNRKIIHPKAQQNSGFPTDTADTDNPVHLRTINFEFTTDMVDSKNPAKMFHLGVCQGDAPTQSRFREWILTETPVCPSTFEKLEMKFETWL